MALAGGVNLILTPHMYQVECQSQMLSADGLCKTFDERADGFVRGEGVGIVVLKRLDDALKSKDHILGVIKGSATGHDGASSGYSVPNGESQKAVFRSALQDANLKLTILMYWKRMAQALRWVIPLS